MSRLGSHTHAQKDSGLSGVASLAQRRRGGPDTCRAACSQPTDEHESLLHNLKVTPHFCAGMLSVVHGEQGTLGWGETRRDGEGKKFIQRAGLPYSCFSFWKNLCASSSNTVWTHHLTSQSFECQSQLILFFLLFFINWHCFLYIYAAF